MLNSVFRNLIFNAVKFSNKDGVIKINAARENGNIKIEVEDNGIGMDEETQSHMFEPFFTTKTVSPDKEASLNSGLGVSVVYEIVESHQGTIDVESELGKGTTITIFLPQEPLAQSEQG